MGDLPYIFLHFHPPVYFKFDSILVEKKKKKERKEKKKEKTLEEVTFLANLSNTFKRSW